MQLQVAGWGGLQQLRWGGIQGCCTCVDVAGTSSKSVSLLFYMLLRCKEARELRPPTDVTSAKCAMVRRKKRKTLLMCKGSLTAAISGDESLSTEASCRRVYAMNNMQRPGL